MAVSLLAGSGRYLERGTRPAQGLAVARMARQCDLSLRRGIASEIRSATANRRAAPTFSFDAISRSRAICAIRGSTFVERFDSNSYLYVNPCNGFIFDLAAEYDRPELAPRLPGYSRHGSA